MIESPRDDVAFVCKIASQLYDRGWMPGTAGNISILQSDKSAFAVTASGRDKGELVESDVVIASVEDGAAVEGAHAPSAESAIHAAIYRCTSAKAVIHVHSPYATALSCRSDQGITTVDIAEYELSKGLGHLESSLVPTFPNWPDVSRIATDLAGYFSGLPQSPPPAMLIRRHGVTVWADTLRQAKNRLECIEGIAQLELLTGTASHVQISI